MPSLPACNQPVIILKHQHIFNAASLQTSSTLIFGLPVVLWVSCRYVGVTVSILVVDVVVNFLSQVIFLFLFFLSMVMYANEVETKEKENYLI